MYVILDLELHMYVYLFIVHTYMYMYVWYMSTIWYVLIDFRKNVQYSVDYKYLPHIKPNCMKSSLIVNNRNGTSDNSSYAFIAFLMFSMCISAKLWDEIT